MNTKIYRRFLGSALKRFDFSQRLYNYYYLIRNKRKFLEMVNNRENVSIFDWKDLIAPLPYCPFEKIKDSNFYGYVHSIKKYIGLPDAKIAIEHGLYLDDNVSYFAKFNTFDTILTFSPFRSNTLRKHGVNKPILEIGPYIDYVEPLLSKKSIESIKKQLGKILLFMPSHSTNLSNGTSKEFKKDLDEVIKLKKKLKFDSVLVCVYYRDFDYVDCIESYNKNGFILTTAGHQLDLNFARRLKSIIELSDLVAVNSVGTNLGFCVAMNKPVTYVNLREDSFSKNLSGYNARIEIVQPFSTLVEQISDDQRKVIKKYWGLGYFKTPEQIRSFLAGE